MHYAIKALKKEHISNLMEIYNQQSSFSQKLRSSQFSQIS